MKIITLLLLSTYSMYLTASTDFHFDGMDLKVLDECTYIERDGSYICADNAYWIFFDKYEEKEKSFKQLDELKLEKEIVHKNIKKTIEEYSHYYIVMSSIDAELDSTIHQYSVCKDDSCLMVMAYHQKHIYLVLSQLNIELLDIYNL